MSDDLEKRVEELEGLVELQRERMNHAMEKIGEATERIDALEAENDALREEVTRLRDRTDMVQQVKQASALKPDERAAVLIQTLYNDAHANEDAGLKPKAKLDTKQSKSALGGGMNRSKAWQAMQRAVELVAEASGQEDVDEEHRLLQYVKVPRSDSENSHLLLDLRNGDMPTVVANFDIASPGGLVADD